MSNKQKTLTEEDEESVFFEQQAFYDLEQTRKIPNQLLKTDEMQNSQKNNQKAEDLIGLITHQIQHEIQESHISISDSKKPFQLTNKSTINFIKNDSQNNDERKIAQLVKKRKDLEEQIKRLKLEKEQQKKKSRSKNPQQDSNIKFFRSNFTEKQHMEISRIMKKSQQFQQHLQTKQKQLAQKLQAERQIQQKQQKHSLEKLKQKKKIEALKKIQKIEEQQRQREQKLKMQNKKYQELKKTKVLHQKIEQHDKQYEEQKRIKQAQFFKQKRQSMTFNFEQIKNHEKKCYQTARQSKQKLENQLSQKIQKMKENEKFQYQTFRPSKFLLTLWSEQKQKEEQQRERIQKMKLLFNKKNNFQENLRDIHKEKIRTKPKDDMRQSIIEEKLQQRRLKVKSMSAADIYKQGQQYMKSVHSSITPVLIENSKVELQKSYKQLKDGSKIQYRDYLQEHKMKESLYKSTGKLSLKQNPEIHRLQNLIGNKKSNPNQKLYRAKIIAQKLDKRAQNSSTSALIDSISAKLKIIEEFS